MFFVSEFDRIATFHLHIQVFLGSDFLLCVSNALSSDSALNCHFIPLEVNYSKTGGFPFFIFLFLLREPVSYQASPSAEDVTVR